MDPLLGTGSNSERHYAAKGYADGLLRFDHAIITSAVSGKSYEKVPLSHSPNLYYARAGSRKVHRLPRHRRCGGAGLLQSGERHSSWMQMPSYRQLPFYLGIEAAATCLWVDYEGA